MIKLFSARNFGFAILAFLIVAQFFRIDKTNPTIDITKDFIAISNPNEEVKRILKASCYDCHSNETKYPWYTNVAPVSWMVKNHINEGRKHLNFSVWGTYDLKKLDHKLEECVDEVKEGEMPMSAYSLFHNEAILSEAQKAVLVDWFGSLRK